ncbi:uncharacterized protein LOC124917958 [Impatiens glandulifera]|uniref:uncharacterized protein LOC124917958 n=1 Tax=Impatiens glandulifera TaxID=253017 RepID=UPI001FB0A594|nr:uncharacterized protein LOC124917958 [Impatiens glandulifera]
MLLLQRRATTMSWRRVVKALQALATHLSLFSFTLLLVLKLDRIVSYSWWTIFSPLWLFHLIIARARFSLPAPTVPNDRRWAPFHAVMAMPLAVAFELLLCVYLQNIYAVNLKIIFFPLLTLEIAILVDNVRMCRALMPGDEEIMSDEAMWETLPHFWVAISMVFLIAATTFTLLKISGDVAALGWWDLFINFGIAEGFGFIICTKWHNPAIHRHPIDQDQTGMCSLQDIGGHIMKVPLIGFQILLFMHLEGTPDGARHMPMAVVFSPLLFLQGTGILFTIYRLVEKLVLLVHGGDGSETYLRISSRAQECFGFMIRGSRLLGWWSIDEESQREQAQLYYGDCSGYNTFSPEAVKKMPRSDLADEVWRLQAALSAQREITRFSQQEFEKLQNEKVLCRICFEEQINIVLLPCRHHNLCSICCEKCKRCPICREAIEERLHVSNV